MYVNKPLPLHRSPDHLYIVLRASCGFAVYWAPTRMLVATCTSFEGACAVADSCESMA